MIQELTKAQEEQLQVYRDRYIEIGLNTDRIDQSIVKNIIDNFYTEILDKKPVPFKIFPSPLMSILFINYYSQLKKSCKQVINKEFEKEEMIKALKDKKIFYVDSYLYGSFDSYYFSFYNYMNEVLEIQYDNKDKYDIYRELLNFGHVYCLDDICVINEKPMVIHINEENFLHADEKAALVYEDGFSLYRLNGVTVPKELVLTPAEKLDSKMVLTEQNAEVRREIIRKIGIDKVITDLGAKLIETSTDGMYELLNFDCIDEQYRPYLKMKNPSIDAWHVEGIHPDCLTIDQALGFRNPFIPQEQWGQKDFKYDHPEILT